MSTFGTQKFNWKLWLGVLISIITLAMVFYRVEWQELVNAMRRASIRSIILGLLFLKANLVLRSWRWKVLLRPLDKFGLFKQCLPYYMIGYMSNLLLPLRAGEIIRPYFFGQKNAVSKTAVFASVLVERLIDIVFLAVLLLFVILIASMQVPVEVKHVAFVLGGLACVLLLLLWVLPLDRQLIRRFEWINRLPKSIGNKLLGRISSVTLFLKALHNTSTIMGVFCFTLGLWLCGVLTIRYFLMSFGIEVPWYTPIFVIVVTNLGMMVPSSPGFIGVAHFLYVFSLSLFGIEKSTALAFAIVIHGLSFSLIVVLGLLHLWKEGLSFSNISETKLREDPRYIQKQLL